MFQLIFLGVDHTRITRFTFTFGFEEDGSMGRYVWPYLKTYFPSLFPLMNFVTSDLTV